MLERWRSGDQEAAEELYRLYAQRLCRLAEGIDLDGVAARGAREAVARPDRITKGGKASEATCEIDDPEVDVWVWGSHDPSRRRNPMPGRCRPIQFRRLIEARERPAWHAQSNEHTHR